MSERHPPPLSDRSSDSPPTSRWWALAALLLVLAALAARLVFFVGYQGRDDRNYLAYAHYLATGGELSALDVHTQWLGRVGFWMPIAATIDIFGHNGLGYVAYPLLYSLAGVLLTLSLGAATVGRRAALLAAALLAIQPLDVIYATRAYPDLPVGVAMVAAFWLALKSRAAPRTAWLALATGLMMGVAYLLKESAILAFLPLVIALRFWRLEYWRPLILVGAGFAIILAIETAFWSAVKDDPFYRVHSASAVSDDLGRADQQRRLSGRSESGWIPGPHPRHVYRSNDSLTDAFLMLGANEEFGLLYWLVIPMVAVGMSRRDRPTADLRMWMLVLLGLLLFFPVFQWPRYTLPRDPRYFTCLTIPALLIVSYYLLRARPLVRGVLMGGLLGTNLAAAYVAAESSRMEPQLTMLELAAPDNRLWVTPQYGADLLFLSGRATPNIGVHLLEQGERARSFQAVALMAPEVPVARSVSELDSGTLVIRSQNEELAPTGCIESGRIEPRPAWMVRQVQALVTGVGFPVLAEKLSPGGGDSAVLYRLPCGPK